MNSTVTSRVYQRDGKIVHELVCGEYVMEVVPESGARVTSLSHGLHGEWLADAGRSPSLGRESSWSEGDMRGWDECLPNIEAGTHPQVAVALADHGEVWNRPWDWHETSTGMKMRINGMLLPFEFERIFSLSHRGVTAKYRLNNVGDMAYSIDWAMHLLLRGNPTNLILCGDVPVRVDSLIGLADISAPRGWVAWGELTALLPFSTSGWAAKIFTKPGATASIALADDRGKITVSISDTPVAPTFGLWINSGGWPTGLPVHHIGIEPGFGDHDALADSVANGSALHAEPNSAHTWNISLKAE